MSRDDLAAELAAVQLELEGIICHRLSGQVDPSRIRRYGVLLAREEMLLLEMRRMRRVPRAAVEMT